MDYCPHCSQTLLYSANPLLHVIRKVGRSHKRYCPDCGRKWCGRARAYNNGGVFVFVMITGIIGMFGFFQLSSSIHLSAGKMQESVTGGLMQQAVQSMADSPMATAELQKMGISKNQAMAKIKELKNNPAAMAKLKNLKNNPAALSKLSGQKREMAQKAMQYMDR